MLSRLLDSLLCAEPFVLSLSAVSHGSNVSRIIFGDTSTVQQTVAGEDEGSPSHSQGDDLHDLLFGNFSSSDLQTSASPTYVTSSLVCSVRESFLIGE